MGFGEAGEVAAPAELADAQLESPDASVPEAVAVAVAGEAPERQPKVRLG